MVATQDIMTALEGIQSALQADGYELAVAPTGADGFAIRVEAGPQACAECLIPKSLLSDMIAAVAPAGIEWSLHYPLEGSSGD